MDSNKSNNKNKTIKHNKIISSSVPVRKASSKYSSNLYDKNVLKTLLKHLSKQSRRKRKLPVKEICPGEDSTVGRIDHQVKLRCRQLTAVVQELRKAVMRQDWDEVVTLVLILCHPGLKYYNSVIIRACFILLCNHPNSSLGLLEKFIRQMTEYILEEDIKKFIRILFALKKSGLDPLKSGKYVRKTGDYKVTRDPEFERL